MLLLSPKDISLSQRTNMWCCNVNVELGYEQKIHLLYIFLNYYHINKNLHN